MKVNRKKIALFVGDGFIAHATVAPLIRKILKLGVEPIIYRTGKSKSDKAKVEEYQEATFFEVSLLNNSVLPFINNNPVLLDEQKNLVDGKCYSYEQLSLLYDFEVHDIDNINDPILVTEIKENSDIIGGLSIRNYQIFKEAMINAFRDKGFFWNLHTGHLPHYKGVFIPYRALQNDDKIFGWTLHRIDQNIDTGNIIASVDLPLDAKESIFNIYMDMVDCAVVLIENALISHFRHGFLEGQKQPENEKSYYTFPTPEEMQDFYNNGIRYIKTPKDIVDRYIHHFSVEGTEHSFQLMRALISAIAEYAEDQSSANKEKTVSRVA